LLEYDDVLNKQREVIYSKRREFLKGEGLKEAVSRYGAELSEEIAGALRGQRSSSKRLGFKRPKRSVPPSI
jgi:preprotein translocase subunit SecA